MGCGNSKSPETNVEPPAKSAAYEPGNRRAQLSEVSKNTVLSAEAKEELVRLYNKSLVLGEDGQPEEPPKLDKSKMRLLFQQMDDTTFDHMYLLFGKGDGHCEQNEFVMTMGLMSHGQDLDMNGRIELAFNLFDTQQEGVLTKAEFTQMITATMNLGLGFIIHSPTGANFFKKQLQQEYSEENIIFWQAVVDWEKGNGGTEEAWNIYTEYCDPSGESMVNLPNNLRNELKSSLQAAQQSDAPVSREVLKPCKMEIFQLMERDSYSRFKRNTELVAEMIDTFFSEADAHGRGVVTFEEYKDWVTANPEALGVVLSVGRSTKHLIQPRTQRSSVIHRASLLLGFQFRARSSSRSSRSSRASSQASLRFSGRRSISSMLSSKVTPECSEEGSKEGGSFQGLRGSLNAPEATIQEEVQDLGKTKEEQDLGKTKEEQDLDQVDLDSKGQTAEDHAMDSVGGPFGNGGRARIAFEQKEPG